MILFVYRGKGGSWSSLLVVSFIQHISLKFPGVLLEHMALEFILDLLIICYPDNISSTPLNSILHLAVSNCQFVHICKPLAFVLCRDFTTRFRKNLDFFCLQQL